MKPFLREIQKLNGEEHLVKDQASCISWNESSKYYLVIMGKDEHLKVEHSGTFEIWKGFKFQK